MSESNKSYRIKTNVGSEYNGDLKLDLNLLQDYDEFELLSLKIGTENLYKYHTSHYGCVVGRVLANGGVGVPNVKISAFIPVDDIDTTDPVFSFLYPYSSTRDRNRDNIRYNLLTDTKIDDCHQNIGTFPNKRLVLDDNNVIEIYDKYYKFTTTTNGSGDYMLFGLPVGNNIIHSDLDLSDIGILSQKPRDLFYKGYTAKQFENASQFKKDTNLDNLTQVISQDSSVYVFPFWGDETENEGQIKIVRNDIDVNYKFEPTCIFIGCIVSDEKSNAISKNCIPHERMGKMDRLTTGAGTIEMIRKTISGDIESFSIQGNELIDGNGTWCYQIPMNLDYMATDEYGNLVPTDNYDKGIPTRTSVRFRVSLADYESDYENAHLVKVLVPNNPKEILNNKNKLVDLDFDYEFGSATKDESFRDMFWNNVYTVKSYIPRIQKGNRQRNKNFTGFKAVNVNGANNPIPYNNMRINLTFLFVFQCLIFKALIMIVKILNKIVYIVDLFLSVSSKKEQNGPTIVYVTLDGGMCPTLDGNYIAPGAKDPPFSPDSALITNTYKSVFGDEMDLKPSGADTMVNQVLQKQHNSTGTTRPYDEHSSDNKNGNYGTNQMSAREYTVDDINSESEYESTESMKIYNTEDYFVKCVELQFAMEYEVIQFDFYNDWINGLIYIPRWFAEIKKNKDYAVYCGDTFWRYRFLTQQCAVGYDSGMTINNNFDVGCRSNKQHCHKRWGRKHISIFGTKNRGIVTTQKNSRGQYAYYLRPSEIFTRTSDRINVKANLFPTDIVMLGSVLDCNQYGIPKVKGYTSSSYMMPPPTAEIISDTQEMNLSTKDKTQDDVRNDLQNNIRGIVINEYTNVMNTPLEWVDEEDGSITGETYLVTVLNERFSEQLEELYKKLDKLTYETPFKNYDPAILKNLNSHDAIVSAATADVIMLDVKRYIDDVINSAVTFCGGFKRLLESSSGDSHKVYTPGIIGSFSALTDSNNYVNASIKEEIAKNYINSLKLVLSGSIDYKHFYSFTKRDVTKIQLDGANGDEDNYSEMAGIDWGYNPFRVGSNDNTTFMANQIAGHFLEIGCTFSLSNIKSCINLQRICEIGSEASQSHYYFDKGKSKWNLLDPTGIIAKREISDGGIRSIFATLNSNSLGVIYNPVNGYKKYNFLPYSPASFMGELGNRAEITALTTTVNVKYENYGLIENQSESYRAFRFNTISKDITSKFLVLDSNMYFMPQYENSFYFYFGLKDGNTAIDRLYTEYYAPCDVNDATPSVTFIIEEVSEDRFILHYSTENMSMIKSIIIKQNGTALRIGEKIIGDFKAIWDKKKHTIEISGNGRFTIIMKDSDNVREKSIVNYKYEGSSEINDMNNDKVTITGKHYDTGNVCTIFYESNFNVGFIGVNPEEYYSYVDTTTPGEIKMPKGIEMEVSFRNLETLRDIKKTISSDDVVVCEVVECDQNNCLIRYEANFDVASVVGEDVGNINYNNKTFLLPKDKITNITFENENKTIQYITVVRTKTNETTDEYTVPLEIYGYEMQNTISVHFREITPTFNVTKVTVDGEEVEINYGNSFDTQSKVGIVEVVFENNNGDRIVRNIDTDFYVTIDSTDCSVNDGNKCLYSYTEHGFHAKEIWSDVIYSACTPTISINAINTGNKTFKLYNGCNDQNGNEIQLTFANTETNPKFYYNLHAYTEPSQNLTCEYDPSDALGEGVARIDPIPESNNIV